MKLSEKPKYYRICAALVAPIFLICIGMAVLCAAFLSPVICMLYPHKIDMDLFERIF